jgi:Tfp pilus assembly protein PilO
MNKLALPIILIILGIASFFWYTQPMYQATDAIQEEIDEYETALSQVGEIQQIRDDLLRQYNQLPRTNLYVMSRVLPERLDTVRMLVELNQIALQYNMTVQDIAFTERTDDKENRPRRNTEEQDTKPKQYESAKVNFAVTGTYEDVTNFVKDVERSTRLIDIIQFQVGGTEEEFNSDSGQGEVVVSFGEEGPPSGEDNMYTITGMTYWLPNEDSQ